MDIHRFYGCLERGIRVMSWNLIWYLAGKSNLPWCILGDFNDLLFADEKRGGRDHPKYCLKGLGSAITDSGLFALGFEEEKFTWEKSRGEPNWVQEHLDRGFANKEWSDMFPSAEVRVIEVVTSDHLPLFLNLNKKVYMPKSKRFRFENVWINEQDCFNLMKQSWEHTEGRVLMEKISYCSMKLEEWGGGQSQEFNLKILDCRQKLKKFRARRDEAGIRFYNAIRWEFMNLLEKKEIY